MSTESLEYFEKWKQRLIKKGVTLDRCQECWMEEIEAIFHGATDAQSEEEALLKIRVMVLEIVHEEILKQKERKVA